MVEGLGGFTDLGNGGFKFVALGVFSFRRFGI